MNSSLPFAVKVLWLCPPIDKLQPVQKNDILRVTTLNLFFAVCFIGTCDEESVWRVHVRGQGLWIHCSQVLVFVLPIRSLLSNRGKPKVIYQHVVASGNSRADCCSMRIAVAACFEAPQCTDDVVTHSGRRASFHAFIHTATASAHTLILVSLCSCCFTVHSTHSR